MAAGSLDRPLVLRVPLSPLSPVDATALRQGGDRARARRSRHRRRRGRRSRRTGWRRPVVPDRDGCARGIVTRRCGSGLPGTLRALRLAARLRRPAIRPAGDHRQRHGARRLWIDTALRHFAEAMEQEFVDDDLVARSPPMDCSTSRAWWRFHSVDVVREVAYPDAHQAKACAAARGGRGRHRRREGAPRRGLRAPRRHGRRAGGRARPRRGRATLPSASAPCKHCSGASREAMIRALGACGPARQSGPRSPGAPRPRTNGSSCCVRSTAHLDLRRFSLAEADARRVLERALALATGPTKPRPAGASARVSTCRATWRRRGPSWSAAAAGTFRGVEDPKRLANGLRHEDSPSCSAVRWIGPGRSRSRWRSTRSSATNEATPGPTSAWASFLSGDFVLAEELLGQARAQFGRLGDRVGVMGRRPAGVRHLLPAALRRGPGAGDVGHRRRQAVGRRLGAADDEHAARQHAAVERSPRRGRAVRREGARRLPATGRAYGCGGHPHAGPAQPGQRGSASSPKPAAGAEESMALGHSFGELGLAVQSAAAVAMHLGNSDALVLAEQVLERNRAMGASNAEALVIRIIALCQLGRFDEALATIEDVDVDDFRSDGQPMAGALQLAGDVAELARGRRHGGGRCSGRTTSTSLWRGSAAGVGRPRRSRRAAERRAAVGSRR